MGQVMLLLQVMMIIIVHTFCQQANMFSMSLFHLSTEKWKNIFTRFEAISCALFRGEVPSRACMSKKVIK